MTKTIICFMFSLIVVSSSYAQNHSTKTDRVCVNRCVNEPDQRSFKACYEQCLRQWR